MRRSILFGVMLLAVSLAQGQRVAEEVTKATTEFHDSKPNSDDVPDVYAISGQFERIVVFRFKFKANLLDGMSRMIKEQGIKNAVILSGVGSVRNYHIHAVSNRTFPSKNLFSKDPSAPADIVSMNGYVVNGVVHPHITLADDEKAFGGHLEPETEVFTFAAVTLGVFSEDVDLTNLDDKTYR